ncbi:high-affinity glucose transporter [Phlyctochytrium arcticum]|nr:high-affinity glucose transporter [Phlyctochytrium arcticum]
MTNFNVILICLFVSFGGFLFGYDTGLISGLLDMREFKKDFGPGNDEPVSENDTAILVSILSVGTFFGSLSAGIIADKAGRRWAIILSSFVFAVGCVIQTLAHTLSLMLPGRLIAGLGVGLLSDLIPLYQAEAAPKELRGTLVSCYQLAITIGIVAAQAINQALKDHEGRASYRIPIALQLGFAGFLGFGMLALPDSPRNHLRLGKNEMAIKALCRLRGAKRDDPAIVNEIAKMQRNLEMEGALGEAGYFDLFKGKANQRIQIGIWLQMFQQLTGVNFIFYYGTTFFKSAGLTNNYLVSTITGVVNVVSTLPALYLMERLGRRKLLLLGSAIMFVGMMVVGCVGTAFPAKLDDKDNVIEANQTAGMVTIISTCLFIYGFASSWGPGAFVVTSEIFPLRLRSKGVAVAIASNWFFNWLLGFVTPFLVGRKKLNLGPKIGFLWAAFILLGGVFVYFAVPETKGLSLEEVDMLFDSGISMRKSSQFVVSHYRSDRPHHDNETSTATEYKK